MSEDAVGAVRSGCHTTARTSFLWRGSVASQRPAGRSQSCTMLSAEAYGSAGILRLLVVTRGDEVRVVGRDGQVADDGEEGTATKARWVPLRRIGRSWRKRPR